MTYMLPQGTVLFVGTVADHVRSEQRPFDKAIALFERRDDERYRVTFHFHDGSSLSFKKVYEIE